MKKLFVLLAVISCLTAYDYQQPSKIYNYSGQPIRITGRIQCESGVVKCQGHGKGRILVEHTIDVVLPDQTHEDPKKRKPYDLDAEMKKLDCTILSGHIIATTVEQKVDPKAAGSGKIIQVQKKPQGMKIMDADFKLPGSYTISLGLKAGQVIG